MRKHIRMIGAAGIAPSIILVALIVAPASAAQVDYFLKIPGVDGESTDSRHKGWVDVDSFSWGATYDPVSGKVALTDFHFTTPATRASPLLAEALLTKTPLTSATLVAEKFTSREPVPYLKFELEKVSIVSIEFHGIGDDTIPVDSFSLNYDIIRYEYTRYDEATSQPLEVIRGGYDVTTGTFLPGTIGGALGVTSAR